MDAGLRSDAPTEGDGLLFKEAKERWLRDPAVRARYLAGDFATVRQVNNMNRVVALAAQDGQPASEQAIKILKDSGCSDDQQLALHRRVSKTGSPRQHRPAVVDLCELTGAEIRDAMRGPGGLYGPVAWAHAFKHAAPKMPAEFVGLPETVQAFRVQ